MTEKNGPDEMFEGSISSEKDHSANNEIKDTEEEIIELTDPEESLPSGNQEEEIIEPADFLDELSVSDTDMDESEEIEQQPFGSENDIIELTDSVEESGDADEISWGQAGNDIDASTEDKDLFIFTDSEDEAILEDDDILVDTVFANESSGEPESIDDKAPAGVTSGEKEAAPEGIDMFDNTVLADESTGNDDEELAVLTEIEDKPGQEESGMFNDTVFAGGLTEGADEELSVLTEINDSGEENGDTGVISFTDEALTDSDRDLVELEEAEEGILSGEEEAGGTENFIHDTEKITEMEIGKENDIADSIGMDFEPKITLSKDLTQDEIVGPGIEPESEEIKSELETLKSDAINKDRAVPPLPESRPNQTISLEPFSIPQEQLEAALEKVIHKMFSDKIDGIIIDIIEKAVKNDIENIKKELLKGAAED